VPQAVAARQRSGRVPRNPYNTQAATQNIRANQVPNYVYQVQRLHQYQDLEPGKYLPWQLSVGQATFPTTVFPSLVPESYRGAQPSVQTLHPFAVEQGLLRQQLLFGIPPWPPDQRLVTSFRELNEVHQQLFSTSGRGVPFTTAPHGVALLCPFSLRVPPSLTVAPGPAASVCPIRLSTGRVATLNPCQNASRTVGNVGYPSERKGGVAGTGAAVPAALGKSTVGDVLPMTSILGPDVHFTAKKRRAYSHESFPEKLYRMLEETEREGNDHIVSFIPDGSAVEIHQPIAFEKTIIPKYFRHKQLESFRRQFSMYGFQRPKNGPHRGAYHHQLFIRGRPELLKQIRRVTEIDVVLPPSRTEPTAVGR